MCVEMMIRPADRSDRAELRAMQAASMRTLAAPFYESDVIEAFIAMGTMDDALLDDGTYFAAILGGEIVGSAGWSTRTPGYARGLSQPAPASPGPTVRSVFVHPAAARKGIASRLMARVEAEMAARAFATASLTATLSGIPFYRRLGWRSGAPATIALPGGSLFVGLGMTKALGSTGREAQGSAARCQPLASAA